MVLKQGTVIRKIILDRDNAIYIEGKVNQILVIFNFVKKMINKNK